MALDAEDRIKQLTSADYVRALANVMATATEKQMKMLRVHVAAPNNHRITASELAQQVGYRDWRGVNAQYGRLAGRICGQLDVYPDMRLFILVEPFKKAGSDWELQLRPAVVEALHQIGIP